MLLHMGIFDLFRRPRKKELIDVDRDLKAINEFFKGANGQIRELARLFKEYGELRKRYLHLRAAKASENIMGKSIAEQIKVYDKILKLGQFFVLDVDIVGERIKKIAKSLKTDAEIYKINKKLLDLVRKDEKWTFDW